MKPRSLFLILLAAALPAAVSAKGENAAGSPANSAAPGNNRVAQTALKANGTTVAGASAAVRSSARATASGGRTKAARDEAVSAKVVDGFELMEHSGFRGSLTIKICPEGICLRSRDLDAIMQPNSSIGYLVHRQNKRYLEMDPSKGVPGLGHFSYFRGPEKVVKVGPETLDLRPRDAGGKLKSIAPELKNGGQIDFLPTTHYYIEKYKLNPRTGKPGSCPYWITDLWVCDSLGISKSFAGNVARLCMLPSEYGMPVKVVRLYHSERRSKPLTAERKQYYEKIKRYGLCMSSPQFEGDEVNDLKVVLDIRSARRTRIKVADTQLPAGLTKVKTEMDLVMSDQDSALLRELD